MKKIIGILGVVLVSLLWIQCSPPDDDVYWDSVQLVIEDHLKVENNENYIVGDTLFFELDFSRYLPEEGESNLLDIYETSGANEFSYSFDLLKYSTFSESYQGLWLDDKYVIAEKGIANYSSQVSVILNSGTNIYESRIGVILAEEGEYQLDFDYLNLYSGYTSDKPSVGIEHTITENNPLVLNFTVTK